MPTKTGTEQRGDDLRELERMAREVARLVERSYERWVESTEGLEATQAQMVVFTIAAKRLAQAGVGLTPLVKQLLRAYGLDASFIEIHDEAGSTLVRHSTANRKHQKPSADAVLAPGSKRKDN